MMRLRTELLTIISSKTIKMLFSIKTKRDPLSEVRMEGVEVLGRSDSDDTSINVVSEDASKTSEEPANKNLEIEAGSAMQTMSLGALTVGHPSSKSTSLVFFKKIVKNMVSNSTSGCLTTAPSLY